VAFDPDSATELIDPRLMRAHVRVGKTLRGKLRLDALLAVGGMASVYAATHRNGSRVAVKLLHTELGNDPGIRARFVKEGYAANQVDHPGVVRVIDDDETEDGALFLTMELLDGESIEGRASRLGGRLPVDEVLAIADQVLDVLAAAHDKGVVHRDLKPENIFLTRAGQVKLLDFGIARLRELSAGSKATRTGSILGTPAFMPPEQARGQWTLVDARSDLWALGATAFTLITGRPVHVADTPNESLGAAMTRPAPPLAAIAREIPPEIASLVDRALAYDKTARWASAREMQVALRRVYHRLCDSPITSRPPLEVPASVTLPTLKSPALPAAAETALAISSSRTWLPPLRSLAELPPRIVLLGGAASLLVLLLVPAVVLLARSAGPPSSAAEIQSPSTPSEPLELPPDANAGAHSADPPDASDPVMTVEELPIAPVRTEQPGVKSRPVPRAPTPGAKRPADWKGQRR
jgi:eukaryotic-like serine/threonine-protein kinase